MPPYTETLKGQQNNMRPLGHSDPNSESSSPSPVMSNCHFQPNILYKQGSNCEKKEKLLRKGTTLSMEKEMTKVTHFSSETDTGQHVWVMMHQLSVSRYQGSCHYFLPRYSGNKNYYASRWYETQEDCVSMYCNAFHVDSWMLALEACAGQWPVQHRICLMSKKPETVGRLTPKRGEVKKSAWA